MKEAVLGRKYQLNLAIVSAAHMRLLNKTYRGIDKATDILSFPLDRAEGEMYICLSETRREAKNFGRTYDNFLRFLFIHGLVHLKGHDHGATMERMEAKVRTRFNV
jgi:probable rRNA maturation factor